MRKSICYGKQNKRIKDTIIPNYVRRDIDLCSLPSGRDLASRSLYHTVAWPTGVDGEKNHVQYLRKCAGKLAPKATSNRNNDMIDGTVEAKQQKTNVAELRASIPACAPLVHIPPALTSTKAISRIWPLLAYDD
jgi:hypothetical protein